MAAPKRRRPRCASCNGFFDARNSRAKYCSDECRTRARRGTRGLTPPPKKPPTKRGRLTIVDPDASPPEVEEKKKPLTVEQASESDDPLEELLALRRVIARDIDNSTTPARDRASLSRQLLIIRGHIEAYRAAGEEDPVGEAALTPDEDFDEASY